jgi:hypothetical protein
VGAALLAIPIIALADQIDNGLTNNVNAAKETTSVEANKTTQVAIGIVATNGNNVNGCNFNDANDELKINVQSSDTSKVEVVTPTITFKGTALCDNTGTPAIENAQMVTVKGVSVGSADILFSQGDVNTTGGTFQYQFADFTVNVTPDVTAPSAPAITSPADNSYDNDGNFTVSGTAEANSTVELFEGTTSKGTTQAEGQGNWSKALTGVAQGSHTYTAKATDAAGNISGASNARTVIVDTTAPTVSVNGFTDGDKFIVGATLPTVTCTASDTGGSGVTNASPTPVKTADTRNADGVGKVTYTCTATDNAGNTTSVSKSFSVVYNFSGYLQPINDTAHQPQTGVLESKFKLGQTIPVKFNIYNSASIAVQQATNPTFTKVSHGTCDSQTEPEAVTTETPNAGAQFVWTTDHYQYNWSTKGLQAGEYRIYANLADGTGQQNTDPLKQNYTDICLTK